MPAIPETFHLAARLRSGSILVPGAESGSAAYLTCAGADSWGRCPMALAGQEPLCAGAEWYRRDRDTGRTWRFTFVSDPEITESAVCPAAILDPLGGLVHQA